VKKIFFFILALLTSSNLSFSQFKSDIVNESPLLSPIKVPATKLALCVHGVFAFMQQSTGLAIGLMADIKVASFSISPQANYWKVNEDNNFEMAGIMRFNFDSKGVMPYLDAGIGINFLNKKVKVGTTVVNDNFTNVGLDLGGGVEFLDVGTNYNIFIDGKYKIIIKDDGNVSGYTLTGGIKFIL